MFCRKPRLPRMPMRLPTKIASGSLVHRGGDGGEIRGDMVLEAVFADVAQKLLHVRNLNHAGAAKRFQGIISERAPADVAADFPREVIGGKAREAHGAGFDA